MQPVAGRFHQGTGGPSGKAPDGPDGPDRQDVVRGAAPGRVDFAPILTAVCAALTATPRQAGLDLAVTAHPVVVGAGQAALLCLAVHELVRNALVHAFPTGQRAALGVHLWPTGGNAPRGYLLIADSGRGFAAEPPASAGSGLVLARRFVEGVGGSLVREPGFGTVWRIGLP